MKIHRLKILKEYADAKMQGIKPFEIRKNDRDYKVGDYIYYTAINENGDKIDHEIDKWCFIIRYITNYNQKDGYVVFTDENTGLPF